MESLEEPTARCDNLTWLKTLDNNEGYQSEAFNKIAQAMKEFIPVLNKISQEEFGDKSLRIDEEEIVISRYNGASNKEQIYYRHKDSYVHDKNNELDGMSLRKLSMVIFLNDDIDQVKQSSPDA